MLGSAMKKNTSPHVLEWVAKLKASIPVVSLSPWIRRVASRVPLIFTSIFVLSLLCVSSIYSSMQFASTLRAISLNMDTLSVNMSPEESGTSKLFSGSTSTGHQPLNVTFNAPNGVSEDIPRFIHRMWRDLDSNTPAEWINASKSCQEQNPSYVQYVWTDETAHQFIESYFAWFLSAYTEYRLPLQRVDALRYFLLWHYGGVYLDPEIGCQLPMEPLLHGTEAILPESWPYGVSQQWIASKPQHPFVINVALSFHNIRGYGSLLSEYVTAMLDTGSIHISRILAKWLRSSRNCSDINILPREMFLGTEDSIFMMFESRVPRGDEFSVSQLVFGNPLGWCGAAIALVMMATVIFGLRTSPRRLCDRTSTSLMV
ncbi:mannosyl phosphorylinositol ceramide synthase SUR1 [Penicillium odoratum]|uniref:mannosyl phosphorylinositol ceramide synthase SUR1 n=1 Tax=Penicillium odoratum TaxID=1167516 RepID=UPI002547CE14|nr:mannosyl phosphorylinositol ceramide synthase SUR1 [Penicillium odoratum]KAJ5778800.1 mannosyl phosphorylinositol ceramide synthase SUR1 [Penicillium odoratum]